VAVNLHGRGPQSHRLLLSLHPGRLLAFANADVPGTEALPTWRADEHEVERWSRMLRAFGIAADPSDLDLDRPGLPSPIPAAGATVIHPGAGSAARRWPAERWARVAHRERAAGRRVVVSAGPGERRLAEDVARGPEAPAADVFVGDEDPMPLAALVAEAGRVASSDTGIAHLATALGTPSVVLFGPTPPALWGPPPDRREHRVLWHGSTGDPLGDRPDPGLLRIGVDEVVRALAELPERHAG
jgi:ADP-heptose:LPS heptosyltransferase